MTKQKDYDQFATKQAEIGKMVQEQRTRLEEQERKHQQEQELRLQQMQKEVQNQMI